MLILVIVFNSLLGLFQSIRYTNYCTHLCTYDRINFVTYPIIFTVCVCIKWVHIYAKNSCAAVLDHCDLCMFVS